MLAYRKRALHYAHFTQPHRMAKVGHPMRLRDVGVPEEGLALCAFHALADSSALFNARPTGDPGEILKLLQQAY